jgi:hypothetical protein
MTSERKLIRITYFLALIPLIVGLSIFFAWWIGKAFYLVRLHRLEGYGFIWILISIPLGMAGLITAIVYLSRAPKKNLIIGLGGLFCVLFNVPALMWIIEKQSDIEQRAYVRVFNKSEIDFSEFTIENSSSIEEYGPLDKGDSKTSYFYPKYLNGDFESVPMVDTVKIVIRIQDDIKTIYPPEIYKGQCVKMVVDSGFNLEIK